MAHYLGFSCCRRIISLESIIETIIKTYGLKNLQANIEQMKSIGINIKCPFCEATCWIDPPPPELLKIIDASVPNEH